jgi:hypothetical protein
MVYAVIGEQKSKLEVSRMAVCRDLRPNDDQPGFRGIPDSGGV